MSRDTLIDAVRCMWSSTDYWIKACEKLNDEDASIVLNKLLSASDACSSLTQLYRDNPHLLTSKDTKL